MRKPLGGLVSILLILAVTTISWKSAKSTKHHNFKDGDNSARALLERYITNIYEVARLQESGLALNVFDKAVTGFMNLKAADKVPQTTSILTVVDLNKSSHEKRMWIIDLLDNKLLLNTFCAHGHGSGDDMATKFSNKIDSHQSSLGFYITDNVYFGSNGRSLRLDGMDEGFNSNARQRAIVVHGADYVGEGAIDALGRLGRSYGCPAVPPAVSNEVIDLIKDKTVMFITGNDSRYNSKYLDEERAASFVFPDSDSGNVLASM